MLPKLAALSEIALFAALSENELQGLAQRAVEKRFAIDEMLFWEGEACVGIFLIIQGSVKIFRTSPGGREVMLSIETAPASVAELPLFDGGPYPASVRVTEPVVSLFINKSDFQQFCRQNPDVALKVLAVVGRRLRQLVGLVEAMTFGSVTQRLAKMLLDASKEAGAENFDLPATHQELASRLGTVREVKASLRRAAHNSSSVWRTRSLIVDNSSSSPKYTVRSKPSGPLIVTRAPPLNRSLEIHAA